MRNRILDSVALRRTAQVAIDACLVALAYSMAYVLRFDPGIPSRYEDLLLESVALVVLGKLLVFAVFGLYHKLWRFVDQQDFETTLKAVVVSSMVMVGVFFLHPVLGRERSAARRDRARLPAHPRSRRRGALPRARGDRAALPRRGGQARRRARC